MIALSAWLLLALAPIENPPFKVEWTRSGLEFSNSYQTLIRLAVKAPIIPTIKTGELDYILWMPRGAIGGYYFFNSSHTSADEGYGDIGKWPPDDAVIQLFSADSSRIELSDLVFSSSIRGKSLQTWDFPASGSQPIATLSWADAETGDFEIDYTPRVSGTSLGYFLKKTDLRWAGILDLNIDGSVDSLDRDRFLEWYHLKDTRADWNDDDLIDSSDLVAYESHIPPTPPSAPPSDAPVNFKSSGCSLEYGHSSTTILFLLLIFCVFAMRARTTASHSRRSFFLS